MCGPNDRLLSSTPKIAAILDENTEAAERFETWGGGEGKGGSSYTKPSAYPYSNFPKCPLRSSLANVRNRSVTMHK